MPNINIDIYARLHNAEKQIKDLDDEIGRLGKESKTSDSKIKGLWKQIAGGLIGIAAVKGALRGATGLIKSFMDVATQTENYKVRLEALLGSQEAATNAMSFFQEVASKVPFTLQDIIEAGTTVTAFGADLEKWTPILADLAAVMGMDVTEAAQALGRAYAGGAGAADIFRERGILQIIKDSVLLKDGIDDISKLSLPKFRDAMYDAFTDPEGKISGAADKLAGTWDGMISMLQDAWFQFRQEIMEAGVYDFLKGELKNILDKVKELKESGKLKEWAEDAAEAIKGIIQATKDLTEFLKNVVPPSLNVVKSAYKGWELVAKTVVGNVQYKWLQFKDIWADVQDEMDALEAKFHGANYEIDRQDLLLSDLDEQYSKNIEGADTLSESTKKLTDKSDKLDKALLKLPPILATTKVEADELEIKWKNLTTAFIDNSDAVEDNELALELMAIEAIDTANTFKTVMTDAFKAIGLESDILWGTIDDGTVTTTTRVNTLWGDLSSNISRSFGDACRDILTEGTDLGDAIDLLFEGIVNSVRDFFGQMVTDFFKNNVFKAMSEEATKAASSVTETVSNLAKGGAGVAAGAGPGALAMGIGAAAGTFLGTILGGGGMPKASQAHLKDIVDNTKRIWDVLFIDFKEEVHTMQNILRDIRDNAKDVISVRLAVGNEKLQNIYNALKEIPSGQGGLDFYSGSRGGIFRYHPEEQITVRPNFMIQPQPINVYLDSRKIMSQLYDNTRFGYAKIHPNAIKAR